MINEETQNTALLLIDAQVNMFEPDPVHDAPRVLITLVNLLAQARHTHTPILYMQNNGERGYPDEPGTAGWQIHPDLAPTANDIVLQKGTENAFYQTPLQQKLDELGITRLIIAGMQTEMCIDTTTRAARSLGYDVMLVADGHSTFNSPALTAVQIIAHHNDILTSFAQVLPAAELDWETTVRPPLDLNENFSMPDRDLLQSALTEMEAGSLTYAHPMISLYKLRMTFDSHFRPPQYRLAKPDWLVVVTETLLGQLTRETAVFRQLIVTDVSEAVQLIIKAVTQEQEADLKPLNDDATLWRLQTQFYRLIYHQNAADKKLTLLALTAQEQHEAPTERDKFLKRFGHA
jgi:nicotinamidase-related amidase